MRGRQRQRRVRRVDGVRGERKSNLGCETTDAIDASCYRLSVGDDILDKQYSAGSISCMACGIGRRLEAV
jgi:hypothetical protein